MKFTRSKIGPLIGHGRTFAEMRCLARRFFAASVMSTACPALVMLLCLPPISPPAPAQNGRDLPSAISKTQEEAPGWFCRGMPGPGQAALEPLIGTWRVHKEVHATLGRSPDDPPIVSDDLICRRAWIADGRFIEDTTEGTVMKTRYWRRGWLGYSNMDSRYDWVTVDAINSTMMIYHGSSGSGVQAPIVMSGVFTDQGVSGEKNVGKVIGMRTVIRIESSDKQTIELYFTPPDAKEVLADRSTYTRIQRLNAKQSTPHPTRRIE